MNTQVLRYVLEVERTGSISKAAENLYMSQPNLSKAIKELENTLNITIFHRTSGGVHLTQKGRAFVGMARNVLTQVAAMEGLYLQEEYAPHTLQLCTPHAAYISGAFAKLANELRREGALVDFQFREMNSAQVIRSVVEDKCRMGIIRCQAAHEKHFTGVLHENGLECIKLAEFPACALVSRRHPLSGQKTVRLEALRNYPQIAQDDWREGLSACSGKQRLQVSESCGEILAHELGTRFDMLCRMDDAYMFSEPMPQDVLDRLHLAECVIEDAPNIFNDGLVFRTGYQMSKLEERLVSMLWDEAEDMLARVKQQTNNK